jgi:hypothetical protein
MSRKKKLGNAAKVLGGLGAAYLASGYIRPGVQPEDVSAEDAAADAAATRARVEANRVDKRSAPEPEPAPATPAARLQPRVEDVDFFQGERDPGLFGVGKKKGGVVSASRRADGIAQRGKTRGKMV